MRFLTALFFYSIILALGVFASGPEPSTPTSGAIIYTAAPKFESLAWLHGKPVYPQGAKLFIFDGKSDRELVPSFVASADANPNFEGTHILFAGKQKSTDHWQIWELELQTNKLRQITSGIHDSIRPFYLPGDRLVYARVTGGRYGLESNALDGSSPATLFFSPGNALPTDVLRDGRILFEASYPLGSGRDPEIYTVYSDGSGVESYRCDHGKARYAGRQIASGDIVFTHGDSLARFTSPLAEEVKVDAPNGQYAGDIVEGPSGDWLVSYRPPPSSLFGLFKWRLGESSVQQVAVQPGFNLLHPVIVAARDIPNRHPSGLHEWKTANLLALNARFSRDQNLDPSTSTVRLYSLNEKGKQILLGSSPIEKDGSFFLSVPGDRPLKFELLDANGKIVRRESGWMWARTGEQRICVGCHVGPENAPENAVPQVLLRSTTPVDLVSSHQPTREGAR